MNDEFLFTCRPSVNQAFSEGLYQRLIQSQKGGTMEKHINNQRHLNWKLVLAAFSIAIVGIFTLSPKARVFAGKVIDEIAGFFVEERTEHPLAEYFDDDGVLDVSKATVVFMTPVPVESILDNRSFEFSMPEYIPEGFTLFQKSAIQTDSWVSIRYNKSHVGEIHFMPELVTPELSIGVASSEEIIINDAPALLIRGDWARDSSHTWNPDAGFTICWSVNGVNYRLIFDRATGFNPDDLLPELIKMAESVH
ncbi:MAG: hypothetical protein H0S79_06535 [Anaerolineaceae bacterium]|jgi:hypothetical protein|nr:hypothetical protein [Anaerolineaceae bacterium]